MLEMQHNRVGKVPFYKELKINSMKFVITKAENETKL